MIDTRSALAAIRFGTGLRPGETPPADGAALLSGLDAFAGAQPQGVPGIAERFTLLTEQLEARRRMREQKTDREEVRKIARKIRIAAREDAQRLVAGAVEARSGFGVRLTMFWTDHFTVAADNPALALLTTDMIETAIRPHVGGRFPDMLKAVVRHPAMLRFLDQDRSAGPNSAFGQRRDRGLNENLARELMELHTLGVGAGYTQADVRELAELLTGMVIGKDGFAYEPRRAEPGAETVLGKSYGGRRGRLEDVEAALEDLALHRDTARHLAGKLIVHFIGGSPDPRLQAAMAEAYLKADGALAPMYATMLAHASAWKPELLKVKTPLDFVVAALRATGTEGRALMKMPPERFDREILTPLAKMGQPFLRPNGPDGWPEEPETWVTPSGVAARIDWSGGLARKAGDRTDPRAFVEAVLGPLAPETLRRAAAGAENRTVGVALVLASPTFNRR